MPTLIFRKSALRPCETSISAIKKGMSTLIPFTIPRRLADRFAQPLPQFGQFGRLLRIIRHQSIAAGGNGLAAIRTAHQRFRQPLQRSGIQTVGEHLRTNNRSLLHVEEQIHAAPDEAFVKQMAERRRLAEVPFPAALFGELRGKIGQIGEYVRRNDLGLGRLAIVGKKGLHDGFTHLFMADTR